MLNPSRAKTCLGEFESLSSFAQKISYRHTTVFEANLAVVRRGEVVVDLDVAVVGGAHQRAAGFELERLVLDLAAGADGFTIAVGLLFTAEILRLRLGSCRSQ